MGGFAFWLSSGVDAHTRDKGAASARTAMVIHNQVIHEVHDRSSREAEAAGSATPVVDHRRGHPAQSRARERERSSSSSRQTDRAID